MEYRKPSFIDRFLFGTQSPENSSSENKTEEPLHIAVDVLDTEGVEIDLHTDEIHEALAIENEVPEKSLESITVSFPEFEKMEYITPPKIEKAQYAEVISDFLPKSEPVPKEESMVEVVLVEESPETAHKSAESNIAEIQIETEEPPVVFSPESQLMHGAVSQIPQNEEVLESPTISYPIFEIQEDEKKPVEEILQPTQNITFPRYEEKKVIATSEEAVTPEIIRTVDIVEEPLKSTMPIIETVFAQTDLPKEEVLSESVKLTVSEEIPTYVPVHVEDVVNAQTPEQVAEEAITIPPWKSSHLSRTGPQNYVHVPIEILDPEGEVAELVFPDETEEHKKDTVRLAAQTSYSSTVESALSHEASLSDETPEWLPKLSKKLPVKDLDAIPDTTETQGIENMAPLKYEIDKLVESQPEPQKVTEQTEKMEQRFVLESGEWPRSMQDLIVLLGTIPHLEWVKHVHGDTNHFADWMEEALKEHELAKMARNYHNPQALSTFLRHSR